MRRLLFLPWRRVEPHTHAQELLSAYLDGWVSPRERGIVEDHLARCTRCRDDLDDLRATVALLGRMQPVPPPRRLTLHEPARARPVRGPQRLPLASAAAGLLLALVIAADVADVLPQRMPPLAAPWAPAQEAAPAPTLRSAAPAAGLAAPAPAPMASPVPMEARGAQADLSTPSEGPVARAKAAGEPLPSAVPDAEGAWAANPWRLVEVALGVLTLLLFALWAMKAARGVKV